MIKLCLLLHGSKFVRFSRVVVACCHVWRRQATTAWSLVSSGWFSLSRRFYHHPSLGCLRPLLVQHYPWPFEPRIFMVRFLSFMYKIFTDISFMCRTFIEIQTRRSISVLLLEKVRTLGRAKARLGRRQFVCPSVTCVTSQLSSIIWWFRPRKPYIFWLHII